MQTEGWFIWPQLTRSALLKNPLVGNDSLLIGFLQTPKSPTNLKQPQYWSVCISLGLQYYLVSLFLPVNFQFLFFTLYLSLFFIPCVSDLANQPTNPYYFISFSTFLSRAARVGQSWQRPGAHSGPFSYSLHKRLFGRINKHLLVCAIIFIHLSCNERLLTGSSLFAYLVHSTPYSTSYSQKLWWYLWLPWKMCILFNQWCWWNCWNPSLTMETNFSKVDITWLHLQLPIVDVLENPTVELASNLSNVLLWQE